MKDPLGKIAVRISFLQFFLLSEPDVHDQPVRKKLREKHLCTDGEAADRNVFTALHITHRPAHDLIGAVKAIVVTDRIIRNRVIKKFRPHPTGADRHYADTVASELGIQRTGE